MGARPAGSHRRRGALQVVCAKKSATKSKRKLKADKKGETGGPKQYRRKNEEVVMDGNQGLTEEGVQKNLMMEALVDNDFTKIEGEQTFSQKLQDLKKQSKGLAAEKEKISEEEKERSLQPDYEKPPGVLETITKLVETSIPKEYRGLGVGPSPLFLGFGAVVLIGILAVNFGVGDSLPRFLNNDRQDLLLSAEEKKKLQDKEKEFTKYLKKYPNDLQSIESLAVVKAQLQNFKESNEQLEKLVKFKREDPEVWRLLGEVRQELGKPNESEQAFKTALKLSDNQDLEIAQAYAITLTKNKKYQEAIDFIEDVRSKLPTADDLLKSQAATLDELAARNDLDYSDATAVAPMDRFDKDIQSRVGGILKQAPGEEGTMDEPPPGLIPKGAVSLIPSEVDAILTEQMKSGTRQAQESSMVESPTDDERVLGDEELEVKEGPGGKQELALVTPEDVISQATEQAVEQKSEASGDRPDPEKIKVTQIKMSTVDLDLLVAKIYSVWAGHTVDAMRMYDKLIVEYQYDYRPYLAKGMLLKRDGLKADAERYFIQARYRAPREARGLVEKLANAKQ